VSRDHQIVSAARASQDAAYGRKLSATVRTLKIVNAVWPSRATGPGVAPQNSTHRL